MKVAFLVIFLFVRYEFCEASVALEHGTKTTDGKCYSESKDLKMKIDEMYQIPSKPGSQKQCGQMHCDSSYTIKYEFCGKIGVPKDCHLSEPNYDLPYPECCPKPACLKT